MDHSYIPLYKQAAAMQHQFHDYSHPAAHSPAATVLRNEIHNLTNDLATNKHPRTIEHRIKTIENQLHLAQTMHHSTVDSPFLNSHPGMSNQNPVLNTHQTAMLHKTFETMRRDIRMNPHY